MPRWKPATERFWSKVDKSGDCWVWTGTCSDTGYGCFHDRRAYSTHRYSWLMHFGPIPEGAVVMHTCDNRPCVRPDHLKLGTKKENSLDMANKKRYRVPYLAGEDHGGSKLTDAAVSEILSSTETGRFLARKYGVSESAVSLVRRGKSWRRTAKRLSQQAFDFTAA